ncbi:hypothetical protein Godav_004164 [Gossypium davidsonii]|uniref:RNase H type-1 domain-containing protein n=1 Tax=Gossypium davidsonii TaxID=34287 RepID=A0A7J8SK61_GOSDV|nr:hypothetical protein [Gossypium davidsonii]
MQVWSKLNCRWPSYVADLNFNEWLNWLFVNSASNTKEEIAITIWAIWFARNKLLHERETQSVKEVITFIRGYGRDYREIEVDVGFSEANNRVAPGFLIRNDDSNLMGLRFRMHNLVRTVVLAEAMAVLHGLQFESHLGSDSLWRGASHLVVSNSSREKEIQQCMKFASEGMKHSEDSFSVKDAQLRVLELWIWIVVSTNLRSCLPILFAVLG